MDLASFTEAINEHAIYHGAGVHRGDNIPNRTGSGQLSVSRAYKRKVAAFYTEKEGFYGG
jgi:hypothetical protein